MTEGLVLYKGNLTYVIPELDIDSTLIGLVSESYQDNRTKRDGEAYHITICTKSEYQIPEDKIDLLREKYDWSKYIVLGIGMTKNENSETYYAVVWYPEARKLRELLKLPPKDFHITLGFKHSDVHDRSKDLNTLIKLNPALVNDVKNIPLTSFTPDEQRLLIGQLLCHEDEYGTSFDNQKLRIQLHYHLKEYDACLEILNSIDDFSDSLEERQIQEYKVHIMLKQNRVHNALQILRKIPEEDRNDTWNALMNDASYRVAGRADTRIRRVIHIGDEEIKLSRNFSWLIPLKLAGISIPKSSDQIRAFQHANIGLIITVMEEEKLPEEWFKNTGIEYAYYSVPNYGTPTLEEMDEIISKMENIMGQDRAVLVHCGGGKGRAGTVLSCFMAKNGLSGSIQEYPQMTAQEAIAYVREMRPGSVESTKQEKFISDYINHLYKGS